MAAAGRAEKVDASTLPSSPVTAPLRGAPKETAADADAVAVAVVVVAAAAAAKRVQVLAKKRFLLEKRSMIYFKMSILIDIS